MASRSRCSHSTGTRHAARSMTSIRSRPWPTTVCSMSWALAISTAGVTAAVTSVRRHRGPGAVEAEHDMVTRATRLGARQLGDGVAPIAGGQAEAGSADRRPERIGERVDPESGQLDVARGQGDVGAGPASPLEEVRPAVGRADEGLGRAELVRGGIEVAVVDRGVGEREQRGDGRVEPRLRRVDRRSPAARPGPAPDRRSPDGRAPRPAPARPAGWTSSGPRA